MFGRKTLQHIDEEFYRRSKKYTGDSYNRQGLFSWERKAIDTHFTSCRRILLIGAGGGREVLALCRLGYEVTAAECHPKLVDSANRLLAAEGLAADVLLVERDGVPSQGPPYDGAIIGWGAYMLIQGRRRRIGFLSRLRDRVLPGAPLLLSFYPRREGERRFHRTAAVSNVLRQLLRLEPRDVGDTLAPNYVHYFTEMELASELADAGFDIVSYWARPYGHAIARAGSRRISP